MFSQLFGKYLIENDVINEGQFDDILAKMEQTRAKLGLIAVSEGILTKEKAEEINILQTQKDARFGDIAVEKGYITKEQLDTLLSKQGNPYMKFIQVLEEVTGIEQSKIDKYVEDFRKSIGFTPEELESLKNEDIDKIVPMFAYASNPYVTRIAALALRNITRFVTTNYYIGKIEHVSSFDYRAFAGQRCEGAINTVIGFAVKNDEKAFLKIADGYSKNGSYSLGLESYDAVGEFVNCIDGLFSSAVSTEDIEIEILPQFSYENQIAKGSAYVLPIYINGSEVSLYIAVDSEVTIGQMPVTRKIAVKAGSIDVTGEKTTVLIVDDSGLSRMMLRNILEEAGYCIVAEASDGLEGELAYKQYQPDIVTLDITMPNMDGIECLEKIMDYDPDANVIMITAAGQQNKVIKALKEGAKKFVTKPYNVEDVLKNIGEMAE